MDMLLILNKQNNSFFFFFVSFFLKIQIISYDRTIAIMIWTIVFVLQLFSMEVHSTRNQDTPACSGLFVSVRPYWSTSAFI